MTYDDDQDQGVDFTFRLDDETVGRLMKLANICHADPRKIGASLLRDILKDDELAHESFDDIPAPDLRKLH